MSVTDLIADQLTVIRNAIRAGKKTVIIKRSRILQDIIEIIKNEGFVENYVVMEDNQQGKIKIYLKYLEDGKPVMENLKRISKPGRRVYVGSDDVKPVMGGVGLSIYSTSKGVITDTKVREEGVGGEHLCQIW
ncbi:MAG: 30S ribosomal protein S8 [Candidatus Tantalella remota]|nr:30S ribosomal protein S8 [Candidatus Tantalella remota]